MKHTVLPDVDTHKGDILVVDDTIANLQLLSSMLKEQGHRVRPVTSGPMALRAARTEAPNLILLDINMPEMDGYQACREFRADDRLCEIPIIFISALGDISNKLKGFEAGAVDFITKPFQLEEVRARVATHLRLQLLQAELAHHNQALSNKTAELERLRELRDNLTHMIVHDLRSPLAGIQGYLELLQINAADRLTGEDQDDIARALASCSRINQMVSSLLDITRLEQAKMPIELSRVDLGQIATECLSELEGLWESRELQTDLPSEPAHARCDRTLTRRIITNLLHNAIRYTDRSGHIGVALKVEGAMVRVFVRDDGPGIAPEFHGKIFRIFGQVEMSQRRQAQSTGLGLAFCKLAVTAQNGEIGLQSEPGKGSTFWFTLPLYQ